MDPTKLPVVTQQDVDQAFKDKLEASGVAAGVTSSLTVANFFLNAPGGPLIQKGLKLGVTGIDVKPTTTGRAAVKIPKVTILAAFLPQPLGYVPAEVYGLHPETYKQNLGVPVGSKPPFFSATESRIKVHEAKQAAADIGRRALGQDVGYHGPPAVPGHTIPPGPINVTLRELRFLQSLPAGLSDVQQLIPQLEARKPDLVGYYNPFKPLTVAEIAQSTGLTEAQVLQKILAAGGTAAAWYAPEDFHSVNDKALANENDDQGGRLMLAADRVDP